MVFSHSYTYLFHPSKQDLSRAMHWGNLRLWAVLGSLATFHGPIILSSGHSTKHKHAQVTDVQIAEKMLESGPHYYWGRKRHEQNVVLPSVILQTWQWHKGHVNKKADKCCKVCNTTIFPGIIQLHCVLWHTCWCWCILLSLKLKKSKAKRRLLRLCGPVVFTWIPDVLRGWNLSASGMLSGSSWVFKATVLSGWGDLEQDG